MTPLEIIQLRAPTFALNANINSFIAHAATNWSTCLSEQTRNLLTALLVCHWLALQAKDVNGNIVGGITSESEGELSRSYGQIQNNSNDNVYYTMTIWGQEILSILKSKTFTVRNRQMTC